MKGCMVEAFDSFRGPKGEQGVGVESVEWRDDKMIVTLTDKSSYTSPSLKGPKGDDGDPGPQGKDGIQGPPGLQGSVIYSGEVVTGEDTAGKVFEHSGIVGAKVGDFYINHVYGGIYECVLGGAANVARWAYRGCIRGPQGEKGLPGNPGAVGPRGSLWFTGTVMDGDENARTYPGCRVLDPRVGDMYLNTATGDVYKCTTAGSESTSQWARVGSILGKTGATGNGIKSASIDEMNRLVLKFTDGSVFTSIPLKGEPGVGIKDVTWNEDFSVTLKLTDDRTFTSAPLKGEKGDTGDVYCPTFNIDPDTLHLMMFIPDGLHDLNFRVSPRGHMEVLIN